MQFNARVLDFFSLNSLHPPSVNSVQRLVFFDPLCKQQVFVLLQVALAHSKALPPKETFYY